MNQLEIEGTADTWGHYVQVRPRFQRSVHIERDAKESNWLDGYLLTPLVRSTARRMAQGLRRGNVSRAWSLTGPYGSGKSAFALFLSQVLSAPHDAAAAARRRLKKEDPEVYGMFFDRGALLNQRTGLIPVIATGERRPLQEIVLSGLFRAVDDFWSGRGSKPDVYYEVEAATQRAALGEAIPVTEVVALVEAVADKIVASQLPGNGLVIILDEAGKAFEYAAHSPDKGDVQLLQELAEAASRSGERPIVFMVLLHQAFEHYASRLSAGQRNEWAKVQGRFEDVIFQESSDDLLRLIGNAIELDERPPQLGKGVDRLVTETAKAADLAGTPPARLKKLLHETLPLHPMTALVLGPLFRSGFAQNERSLFAFLGTSEPCGFQSFLKDTPRLESSRPLYGLDDLYDYLVSTFGGRLYGQRGGSGAQIEAALRRLPADAEQLDARLVKIIGLLGSLPDTSIAASKAALRLAAGDLRPGAEQRLDQALERLRDASIIIFRKYRDAFQLWEGSDLDLDGLADAALREIEPQKTLLKRLTRVAPPRPLIARRHLFQTGTFRYFDLRYGDERSLASDVFQPGRKADGTAWLLIPSSATTADQLVERLANEGTWPATDESTRPVLIGVPGASVHIRELAAELAALEWVQTHTPELHGDTTARRELAGRISEHERLLRNEVNRVIRGEGQCAWFYRGVQVKMTGPRRLAQFVSEVFDRTYRRAPWTKNELLNRDSLSSSAAAARRGLMQAMLQHSTEPRLGIEGNPPELSMYRSFVEKHGLHGAPRGVLGFKPPRGKGEGSLYPAYDALRRRLKSHDGERIAVSELYMQLQEPPYGMKNGVLPILVLALLLQLDRQIAIYEDDSFVAQLDAPAIERLLRAPDRFEVQYYKVAKARAVLLARLVNGGSEPASAGSLLPLVRQLVGFMRNLPDYSRYTKTISPVAQRVREAVFRAKEPAALVFEAIPSACGLPAVGPKSVPEAEVDTLVESLRQALRELGGAYPKLLQEVHGLLADALGLSKRSHDVRRELAQRASVLLPHAGDTFLKGFLIRAADLELDREAWLVSMATHLGGKPPESWRDADRDRVRLAIVNAMRQFHSLESLLIESRAEEEDVDFIRLSVTRPGTVELARVVNLRPSDRRMADLVRIEVHRVLREFRGELSRSNLLAVLALVSEELMDEIPMNVPSETEASHE